MLQTVEHLHQARDERRRGFELTPVSTTEAAEEWRVRDGALQHRTGGFFSVSGFRDHRDGRPRMLLYQPQGAVNGWATRRLEGRRMYLVQARAEPGNAEEVQYGPTLQSTPANYMRLHGGATSPFAELFLVYGRDITPLFETQQLDLGERYALKTKRVGMIETSLEGDLPKGFHWVCPKLLSEACGMDFVLNTDCKAGLGVLPWSQDPNSGELCPQSDLVRRSLRAGLRDDRIGFAVRGVRAVARTLDPVPLEAMQNWRMDDDGLAEITPDQNFAVRFYRCKADAREVRSWIQPLIVAGGSGLAVLACRVRDGVLEARVRFAAETGLATGVAFGPSHLVYPGEKTSPPDWLRESLAKPWLETRESDEGGRFLDHWSRYVLALVHESCEPPEPGVWLNLAELKQLMLVSNLCTIQLRVMMSLFLAAP